MTDTPKPLPSRDAIDAAYRVYADLKMHYYQLLYFQQPRLTAPGANSRPFDVRLDPERLLTVQFAVPEAAEYGFFINDFRPERDEEVLRKCRLVVKALRDKPEKVHQLACCGLARHRPCVCYASFDCEIHGQKCVGSHD
jgi:hypothetical protein